MSCLLQQPTFPSQYSSQSSSLSGVKGLVMESQKYLLNGPQEYVQSFTGQNEEEIQVNGGGSGGRRSTDKLPHYSNSPYPHPEVNTSWERNEFASDGVASNTNLKNEAFYPQQNSPVEPFMNAAFLYLNDYQLNSQPKHRLMDDVSSPSRSILSKALQTPQTSEFFNYNLKSELDNYIQGKQSESQGQFQRARGPISPTSSLSCSSSSLLSLGPLPSPTRRHSFSAAVSTTQSLSCLNGCLTGMDCSGTGQGGFNVSSGSGYYRQRSHTYSTPSKHRPYPMAKQLTGSGWSSALSSQTDLRDRIEKLGIRTNMADEQKGKSEAGRSDQTRDKSQKDQDDGSENSDPFKFLFLGPFGKKRRMVKERQQSMEKGETAQQLVVSSEQSPPDVASPVGSDFGVAREMVGGIAEEDETADNPSISDQGLNEPLNLSTNQDDSDTLERVSRLKISSPVRPSGSDLSLEAPDLSRRNDQSPFEPSFLRSQLLLGQTASTSAPYSMRDRSASMSAVTVGTRQSVIMETRAALMAQSQPSPSTSQSGPVLRLRGTGTAKTPAGCSSKSSGGDSTTACNKKTLQCHDCGKVFSQQRNYRYHRSRHEGTSQFACVCPICHKTFNDKGYLSSHLKIHRNEKEYKCPYCEKEFNQRVAYNMHVRIHTGVKPHECHICDKAFSRKMLLKQHLRTHTGERPYACPHCGKAFADRSNMLLHYKLHSGIRPFHCHLCVKKFSKNHHLKTHLNHHAGIKPYPCPRCNARFSQSSNMKTHLKRCTGGEATPKGSRRRSSTVSSAAGASSSNPSRQNSLPPDTQTPVEPNQPHSSHMFRANDQPVGGVMPNRHQYFETPGSSRNLYGVGAQNFSSQPALEPVEHRRQRSPQPSPSSSLSSYSYEHGLSTSAPGPSSYYHSPHFQQEPVPGPSTAISFIPSPNILHLRTNQSSSIVPPTMTYELQHAGQRTTNYPFHHIHSPPMQPDRLHVSPSHAPAQIPQLSPQQYQLQQQHQPFRGRANTWGSSPVKGGKRKHPPPPPPPQ